MNCELCGNSAWLTKSGRLHALTITGPLHGVYTHELCDDCVRLFNATTWKKTAAKLRSMLGMTLERRVR